MKYHLYTGRAPFGASFNFEVEELSQDAIQEKLEQWEKDNPRQELLDYRIEAEQVRDGRMIHNGLEVMAAKHIHTLVIDSRPRKEKRDAPKELPKL